MITLASDFGSPYPAAMKGVLAQQTNGQLVDITHDFPRQDVHTAAFWLREILPYFPEAVHLVVVDPGVGTDRASLVLRAGGHVFVGPDNGVLVPAARRLANGTDLEAFVIDDTDADSATFHGRDVFAPAAGAIHEQGIESLETLEWLTPIEAFVDYSFPEPDIVPGRIHGTVLVVDDFGNVITNVPGSAIEAYETLLVNGTQAPVTRTFASVSPGEQLVTVGSHGNVELDVNRGRGDEAFELGPGDEVVLEQVS